MATGLLKSNAKQDLVISPVQWAVFPHGPIFPFMGTSFFSYAHLFFQSTSSFHEHIDPLMAYLA